MQPLFLSVLLLAAVSGTSSPPPAQAARSAETTQAGQPATRSATLTLLVTDGTGAPLADVEVRALGPITREGRTTTSGTVRFANVRAGTYRVRFVREGFISFEREVTVRAGQPVHVDTSLSAAPPSPPPPPCPEPSKVPGPPTAPPIGSIGEPNTVAVPAFVENNFIGRAPRKDSRLGCTGSGVATLVQLREAIVEQADERADLWLYVVAGEGTLRVGGDEQSLAAGTFSVVPRTIKQSIVPRGRNPLILILVRTGEPCEGA